ncbi:tetratricopeptide repeat protein [Crocinitomix catalasitica]|uniref:hypothetical protein n=1 Tax=Crocinitomix catalasitica TaxID=184607 RepID=UPI0012FB679C|nr:hypothetical protein [Crocinitomix catalasitica]
MKKTARAIAFILINIGLVFLAFRIYYGSTLHLIKITDTPNGIDTLFLIPILLVGLVLLLMNKKFRRFGIGITALSYSCLFFLIMFLNRSLATEGDFENYKLRRAYWIDNEFYLNIEFNMWANSTPVTQDKCFDVDSVQVRINKGLFGMRTMSNDVKFIEQTNCLPYLIDSTDLVGSHFEIGNKLAVKRCFTKAIAHYTRCIELDALDAEIYYERSLMFMVMEQYDKALKDLITSINLKYKVMDQKAIAQVDNDDLVHYTKELLDNIQKGQDNAAGEYIDIISGINDFETYQMRINFCLEKLK